MFNTTTNKDLQSPIVKSTTIFYLENKTKLGAAIGSSESTSFLIGNALTGYNETLEKTIKETKTSVFYLDQQELEKLNILSKSLFT